MAYQVQFPSFKSGYEKTQETIGMANQALQMGLQVDQAHRVRKQQEWENDYRQLSAGLQMASIKGNTPETKNKFLQTSVAPIWKKWTGQDFPTLDAGNPEDGKELDGLIKDVSGFGDQWAKGKIQFNDAFTLAQRRVADYHSKKATMEDVSGREQAAIKAVMAPFEEGAKREGAKAKDAKSPDEVLKEMFEINKSIAGMQQLDQQTANLMQIAPEAAAGLVGSRLSPEQLGQVKGMGAARMEALNEMLPADKKLQPVTEQEAQALIKAGHSPEEVFRKTFIVQRKSGK